MGRTFDELVAEAEAVPIVGWDFGWLAGRATEERPSWRYQRLLGQRLSRVSSALDLQTGGGEVLAGATTTFPVSMVATESWPPNVAVATRLLGDRGCVVVVHQDGSPLPFGDNAFDLVTSRHPVTVEWEEIARVLHPGGTYLAQHVGPASVFEVVEWFLGPLPEEVRRRRDPDDARAGAEAAGLDVVDLRLERLRIEFHDVGAVIWFLRTVIWMVPDFTVARYRDRLLALHERLESDGPFVAHSTRFLIECRKRVPVRTTYDVPARWVHPLWRELPDGERQAAWDRFDARFHLRPGMDPGTWPAIREPADSVTFDLSPIFSGGPLAAAAWASVDAEALHALVAAFGDEEVTVLDWHHPAYGVRPGQLALGPDHEWPVTVVPDGDYYAFLSPDLSVGTFGHPWEQSLCVIGESMLATLGRTLATWLPVLRRGGKPV